MAFPWTQNSQIAEILLKVVSSDSKTSAFLGHAAGGSTPVQPHLSWPSTAGGEVREVGG